MGGHNKNWKGNNAIIMTMIMVAVAMSNTVVINAVQPGKQDEGRVSSKSAPSPDCEPAILWHDCTVFIKYPNPARYPCCCSSLTNEASKYGFDPKETARVICDAVQDMHPADFAMSNELVFRIIARYCPALYDVNPVFSDCDISSLPAAISTV